MSWIFSQSDWTFLKRAFLCIGRGGRGGRQSHVDGLCVFRDDGLLWMWCEWMLCIAKCVFTGDVFCVIYHVLLNVLFIKSTEAGESCNPKIWGGTKTKNRMAGGWWPYVGELCIFQTSEIDFPCYLEPYSFFLILCKKNMSIFPAYLS